MKSLTSLYLNSLSSMTSVQKMNRVSSLYTDMKKIIELQIKRESEGISGYELKKKIAEKMYSSDVQALGLLESYFKMGLTHDRK
jgi:hypothetical protein